MDLVAIKEIKQADPGGPYPREWRQGDAWLAGGTWLFSEPQPHLRRLVDLESLGWKPLAITKESLEIAATCTIAELYDFELPADWLARPLIRQCCRSFLSSFKIWNTATVGGNICMSLPAGPMISLATGLEGTCVIHQRNGAERKVPTEHFVIGNHQNLLEPGDLLRRIDLPVAAMRKRTAFRRISLTHLGRSSVLIIGTLDPLDGGFMLTVSASTDRPHRFEFLQIPDSYALKTCVEREIPVFFGDAHGTPDYRKHITFYFAEEIRRELSGKPA